MSHDLISDKEIQVIIELRALNSSSSSSAPPPGQMSVSLRFVVTSNVNCSFWNVQSLCFVFSLIKGKRKITHLLPEDEQILTSNNFSKVENFQIIVSLF
jgi:hypothetical protein